MTAVGFLGPGRMGRPMIDRLHQAGHDVTVLARRDEVRKDLEGAGMRVVATPADAARGAEIVIACLFSDEQLLDVCRGPQGVLATLGPSAVLASHVTGRINTVRELQATAAAQGAAMVDAPVSGGVDEIAAGQLTVLLGGEDSAIDKVEQVVSAYSEPRIRTGKLGSALGVKLVNNLLFAAHAQTAAAAITLAEGLGIKQAALLAALGSASGHSYAASTLSNLGAVGTWTDVIGEFLRKDVAACAEELAATGATGGFLLDVVRSGPLPLVD